MTCKNCGKSNPDDATVCKYCGSELKSEGKPKANRAESQGATIHTLRQLTMILAAALVVALILALAGLLRGCSAGNTALEAQTAAEAAQKEAAEAKKLADQNSAALKQALGRIDDLEQSAVNGPTEPDGQPDKPPADAVRYPEKNPVQTLTATLNADGKITALAYTDETGAFVGLTADAAGVPISYVLNDANSEVVYESDIDLCAACEAVVPEGYKGEIRYEWASLTGEVWEPKPTKTDPCLTVSPGFWFSTQAQYRCKVTLVIKDGSGAETDEISVYTDAVNYSAWQKYAEGHADEHECFLQWADMMKTYQ